MKNKHRIKQGLSLFLAGGISLTNLGAVMPAFSEDAPATPENAEAVTPETAEADTTAPNLVQIMIPIKELIMSAYDLRKQREEQDNR